MKIDLLLGALSFSFLFLGISTALTIRYRHGKKTAPLAVDEAPFVSILKPVKDLDDELDKNIESFFLLDYPRYEVLFAADSMDDPCVRLVRGLMAKYSHIPARLISTGHSTTINPKIHKLTLLEPLCRGRFLWIADSNVQVAPDTLLKLVGTAVRRKAKLVFSPIRSTASRSLGSFLENANFNFFSSGNIIAAWALLRQPIIVGKSFLVERDALGRFGGFGTYKNYLAEDFLLGDSFKKSRFPLGSDYTWVTSISQNASLKKIFQRMARWAILRFHLNKGLYVFEILLNPIALAAVGLFWTGARGFRILLAAALLKIFLEYVNFLALNTIDRKKPWAHAAFPFLILLKDALLFVVYLAPFFSRTVRWGGSRIRIGKKTLIMRPENLDSCAHERA